ncbi:MAG TPA: fdrA domain protein [Chloroflexi bacterium]|nr:fdrA domain protein [Chloroflexota bacterium]
MKTELEELLQNGPVVINLGVREFAESLQGQGVEVVHVDWAPPAGGDTEMAELLDKLL